MAGSVFDAFRVGLGFVLGLVQALLCVWSRAGLGFLGDVFIGVFGFIEGMFDIYFGQVHGLVRNGLALFQVGVRLIKVSLGIAVGKFRAWFGVMVPSAYCTD